MDAYAGQSGASGDNPGIRGSEGIGVTAERNTERKLRVGVEFRGVEAGVGEAGRNSPYRKVLRP